MTAKAVLGTALVFKSILLLIVVWILESGRLLFYMVRVRSLQDHVRGDWAFFEENFANHDEKQSADYRDT